MKKIWLADDDEDDRYIFQQVLKKITGEIQLFTSEDGKQLISVLEHAGPCDGDIILLDSNMPGMNGCQTLELLRKDSRFADLPVIIISTSCLPALIDEMYAHGADYYIIKPSCFDKLENMITEMLWLIQNKTCRPERAHFVIGEEQPAFYEGLYYPGNMKASA